MRKTNYLNNKDILKEIHKSKNTFCSYIDPEFSSYDIIVNSVNEINDETVEEAIYNKSKRLCVEKYDAMKAQGIKVKQDECWPEPNSITRHNVVFRVMTFDHIPDEPHKKKNPKTIADVKTKVNFPPFQHWRYNEDNILVCVGKSHWIGGLENGHFSITHGKVTQKLALMWMKLVERYSTRGNVRNYCVDAETQALTDEGWLGIDEISENNKILSYENGVMKWSNIKSVFRGHHSGLMHKMTLRGFDSLVTPEHKFVTVDGIKKVELLKETDRLVLLGEEEVTTHKKVYSDELVELVGWIVTEGCYEKGRKGKFSKISVSQNRGPHADRIRNCLNALKFVFSEKANSKNNISFRISAEDSRIIKNILPEKNLNMEFILNLTTDQRRLLIETMIDGDGWRTGQYKRYAQKCKQHVDLLQILCALSGIRSNYHFKENVISYGKPTSYYVVNLFTKTKNVARVENINFHGGKNNGRKSGQVGKGKENHPNFPVEPYNDRIWCPETEFGSFVARRNGTVYLTGNSYNDEMRGQAIVQLSQIGLQFNEQKSNNPFSYYTSVITNSFVKVINSEKQNQNIRDEILEMNGLDPSHTRLHDAEWDAAVKRNDPEQKNNT